ncbi:hypothetical protein MJO28_014598 [Puccinia striiformis f. sp. tritici]|uniref:Uncharacterized protein n=1 Tax=Puccinia striiformis f. sp. tritici TaxID=168172 RepID=A0ACC0DTX6_9BASI|nr:hypothetical protein MJO28_014598 [Puccinia striiformis f. sp. tritici]
MASLDETPPPIIHQSLSDTERAGGAEGVHHRTEEEDDHVVEDDARHCWWLCDGCAAWQTFPSVHISPSI